MGQKSSPDRSQRPGQFATPDMLDMELASFLGSSLHDELWLRLSLNQNYRTKH